MNNHRHLAQLMSFYVYNVGIEAIIDGLGTTNDIHMGRDLVSFKAGPLLVML